MPTEYPRSPKALLGGLAHLGRLFDKIRMRQKGQIQGYNYLTVGFDKDLLDFLQLDGTAVEERVRQGGTDQELLAWVQSIARPLSDEDIRQWNERILTGQPQDESARIRYHRRLEEIARKRGIPVSRLPPIHTWAEAIDLDEGRL
ncbi:MAG: DUF5069 domain-containing protein [Nitrospira sp.]|jgi:hypothetical protein|nr:DUF5069 domain-containing protein [Nitrospira sp.]